MEEMRDKEHLHDDERRSDRRGPIMRIEFNLGYTCNNNCLFCGEGDNRLKFQKQVKELLTSEQIKNDVSSFARRGYRHLTFLGGEPTIRKDFIEIVRHAKREGFETIFLTTNGRMLSRMKNAKELLDAGLNEICLSFHGANAEAHDTLTQSPGSFDQVRAAMDNLAEIGKEFSISTVITKQNYSQLPDMIEILIPFGTRRILISYPMITGNALKYFERVIARFSDSKPYVKAAIEKAKEGNRMLTVGQVPFCQIDGYEGYADILFWHGDVKRVVKKYRGKGVNPDGSIVDRHGLSKVKKNVCRSCCYYFLCEGMDHQYAKHYGTDELYAIQGEKITDPEIPKSRTHFYNNIDMPIDRDR